MLTDEIVIVPSISRPIIDRVKSTDSSDNTDFASTSAGFAKSEGDGGSNDIPSASQTLTKTFPSAWFYEGRNGWWRYDDRTLLALEDAFAKDPDSPCFEIMISGYVYVVDFRRMVQFRKDEPSRRRRVKRETIDEHIDPLQSVVKGIAGLKLPTGTETIDKKKDGR